MRLKQSREGEGLRGLHGPERGAVERLLDAAAGAHALHGIGHRHARDRRARRLGRRDRPVDQARIHERAGAVVHEAEARLGGPRRHAFEGAQHRDLTGRAAEHRREQALARGPGQVGHARLVELAVVGMDGTEHCADRRMVQEPLQRPGEDWAPADRPILLGQSLAGPASPASRDDDGDDVHAIPVSDWMAAAFSGTAAC